MKCLIAITSCKILAMVGLTTRKKIQYRVTKNLTSVIPNLAGHLLQVWDYVQMVSLIRFNIKPSFQHTSLHVVISPSFFDLLYAIDFEHQIQFWHQKHSKKI